MSLSVADFVYRRDQTLPPMGFWWKTSDGDTIDFSSGWTFTIQIVNRLGIVVVEGADGITGSDTSPNVIVHPEVAWWDGLAGRYFVVLKATDTEGDARIFRVDNLPTVDVLIVPAAAI